MTSLTELVHQIRIALATHPTVTIKYPKPRRLWRALKKELPVCDVTFDEQERAVYVTWKKVHGLDAGLLELSPEERFAQQVYESSKKRLEAE